LPGTVRDNDAAEGRIGIGRERLVPCRLHRVADADSTRSVVLQNRDYSLRFVLKLEDQVYRRADVDDVVVRELLAVELLGDLEEVAVERAGLMWVFAIAQPLLALHS